MWRFCKSGTRRKRAFTLVELLVVIAIIGILIALLLPAVQAAREAARRSQCSNNLKQLGLACHNYHDAFKHFPWNADCGDRSGTESGAVPGHPQDRWNQFSWIVFALPFMEQQPIYDQIDFNVQYGNTGTANNLVLRRTILNTVLCPSNDQEKIRPVWQVSGYRWNGTSNATAAGTDYVGNMGHIWGGWKDCGAVPVFPGPPTAPNIFVLGTIPGTPWVNGEYYNEQAKINGIFRYHGSETMAKVIDGTSSTMLAFEDMHWRGGNNAALPHDRRPGDDSGWMSPLAAVNSIRNPMNNKNKAWLQGAGDRRCHGWSSNHAGGAQGLLCDGSTHFFSETMDHVVRYQLGVRNDGLPLEAF